MLSIFREHLNLLLFVLYAERKEKLKMKMFCLFNEQVRPSNYFPQPFYLAFLKYRQYLTHNHNKL